ncbi:hypothetical protein GCM10009846_29620 [Agrococcus versicolor]|uniref:Outer membrane channel protein CpnT-like N-terminal domain-containing protein n=1 Tax=Agrococcus versicolor TaxID=501482 RepID=A0ABP5MSK7_9MICO
MALNIPSELAFVLDLLGFEWPQLDEDEIHRAAHMVRQFRDDLEGTIEQVGSRVNDDVPAAFSAKAAQSYTDGWNEAREQHMTQLMDLLDPAGTGIDLFADAVLALKLKVIAELVITAAQIAAALAAAAFTFGLSAAANVAIIAARKKVLDIIVEEAIAALIVQIAEMVIDPLTNLAETVILALMDAPVVVAAVGEVEAYQTDFAALEQAASDIDSSGSDQETIGQEFLGQLSTLQISTAG